MLIGCAAAGVEFEKRIVANERDNVKLNFLKSTDPYHKYYQLRVSGMATQHPEACSSKLTRNSSAQSGI
jgi:splicing factor 3A subunit 1